MLQISSLYFQNAFRCLFMENKSDVCVDVSHRALPWKRNGSSVLLLMQMFNSVGGGDETTELVITRYPS